MCFAIYNWFEFVKQGDQKDVGLWDREWHSVKKEDKIPFIKKLGNVQSFKDAFDYNCV